MNVHYCPTCKRGYWVGADLGAMERVPKHTPTGKVHKGKGAVELCTGSRARVEVVRPPSIAKREASL